MVLMGLFAAPASSQDRARHSEQRYSGGSNHVAFVSDCKSVYEGGANLGPSMDVVFETKKGEKSVDVEINDDGPGQTVLAFVYQLGRRPRFFCGHTEGFLIKGGKHVFIDPVNVLTVQGASVPTSGTVEADFHR
jgi:hypothetical protein